MWENMTNVELVEEYARLHRYQMYDTRDALAEYMRKERGLFI